MMRRFEQEEVEPEMAEKEMTVEEVMATSSLEEERKRDSST